ncbi:G/U mismatch-specific DNA glycosylase [Pseudomonas palleroniana]|uniref:G/U mismatch-specific DNA glycosylase n=1 Tax=Pseudomonas palleroniana TaxID=191390 RepID=A0A2L1J417_9PSED|nr:G/U mismatch-specific DNA glycosylase [Pseudomonas palleroniana]AVE03201.1 G/U mismatch-specific DNA glycosylase [Pseudomonas palleroniana]UOK36726.1 G/U mismatch-specific DNA glycosylase [Pseudomonas palleroniana]
MNERLEDILAEHLSVVFCGINPGKGSAAIGQHFANRSNRFWRTLHLAGFTPHEIHPEDGPTLLQYHCGLTTLVERPTASAGELARHEFLQAATAFEQKIRRCRPRYLAFLGKAGYSALSGQRTLAWGLQPQPFAEASVWVLPNPSGRNLAFSLEQLVQAYQPLREAIARAEPMPLLS